MLCRSIRAGTGQASAYAFYKAFSRFLMGLMRDILLDSSRIFVRYLCTFYGSHWQSNQIACWKILSCKRGIQMVALFHSTQGGRGYGC
jgi:hypothetical protein